MEAHALKYSNSYRAKKGYSFWETEFDQMAFKTMLRQIISKWGIMSIELQESFKKDYGKINDDGEVEYVDNVANIDNVANVENVANVANKTTLNFDDFESDTQKNKVDDDDDWKN
jgi:recombination protein RecT